MKLFLRSTLIILIITALPAGRLYAITDAILAVVNDDVITYEDLKGFLNTIYIQLKSEGKSQDEIAAVMKTYQKEGLDRLIENKLLVDAADEQGMSIRPRAIDERVEDIRKQYSSEEEFISSLLSEGMTITDLRNKVSDQLKARYVVELEVKDKIFVNPQEVTEFYETNSDKFQEPEKVELDSIFIAYGEDASQARAQASEALERVRNGENFIEVANKYSQYPSVGMVQKNQMVPVLEEIIFAMKEGDISNLIEVENGIYIFKVKKHYPEKSAPLEEVKKDIYDYLYQLKFRERYQSWMEKLRKKSYVEIKS